jgi:hypothetical protein
VGPPEARGPGRPPRPKDGPAFTLSALHTVVIYFTPAFRDITVCSSSNTRNLIPTDLWVKYDVLEREETSTGIVTATETNKHTRTRHFQARMDSHSLWLLQKQEVSCPKMEEQNETKQHSQLKHGFKEPR